MAKVQFNLNDSLVRRIRDPEAPQAPDGDGPPAPDSKLPQAPVGHDSPSPRAYTPPAEHTPAPVAPNPAETTARSLPATDSHPSVLPSSGRSRTVQTSVILPAPMWDRLASLAAACGAATSTNRALIAILQTHVFDLAQAGQDLNEFVALPSADNHLGEPWEERNVRLPLELRRRLDELRDALSDAGLSQATRANLIAATLTARGPASGDEMRALLAERRAASLRRALATLTSTSAGA